MCYYYDGKLKIPGYVPYLTFHDAILAQLIVYICMYNSVYKSGSPETISKTINNIKVYNIVVVDRILTGKLDCRDAIQYLVQYKSTSTLRFVFCKHLLQR